MKSPRLKLESKLIVLPVVIPKNILNKKNGLKSANVFHDMIYKYLLRNHASGRQ